jgi:hypothetical protein
MTFNKSLTTPLALALFLLALSPSASAQSPDPAALILKAAALENAGQWQSAAEAYGRVAKAYEARGDSRSMASAYAKSARMFEKSAEELLKTPRAAQPSSPQQPPPPPAADVPMQPLENSPIVSKNAKGAFAVALKNGPPLKLSRHDSDIHNPSVTVAPDGSIHVAFVERMAQSPFSYSVYHRSSRDGGKSWTEAKNLSEVMPDYQIGNAQVIADGTGRVYVIWRTGAAPGFPLSGIDPHAAQVVNNFVYRVLEGGAWNAKPVWVHKPATKDAQDIGSASWFASTDPGGKVHVIWNGYPDRLHPEALERNVRSPGIKFGEVMETILEGSTAGPEREIYHARISPEKEAPTWPRCDNLDMMNGYVDAGGKAHILALVTSQRTGREPSNRFQIIEDGMQNTAVELPGNEGDYWAFPPKLLVDARGRRHVITMYPRGEQPNIRDYVVGVDAEPTIIRAAKEVKGKLLGMQAYQGPGGRMVVIMQMNDTGAQTDDELYVSASDGGRWSPPVNITNNTGRIQFQSTQTSSRSHVATESYWYPGPAAAAFDKTGHLVVAYVSKKFGIVNSSAFGVSLGGGSTSTPNLLFLRF